MYIIFDLEWIYNSSKEITNEIYEIGAVKLDDKFHTVDIFETQNKLFFAGSNTPKRIRNINYTFSNSYLSFLKWIGNFNSIICTWSGCDIPEINRNANYYKLPSLSYKAFIDVQLLFKNYYNQPKFPKLKDAYKITNTLEIFNYHNALSDAMYTARLLQHIMQNKQLYNLRDAYNFMNQYQ